MNVLEKLDMVRELIESTLPHKTDRELYDMVRHIARLYEGIKKTPLSHQEKILADLLLRNNYKTQTVMRWMRILFFYPPELREDIRRGKLSFKKAARKKAELIRADLKSDCALMNEIHSDILKLVEGMQDV